MLRLTQIWKNSIKFLSYIDCNIWEKKFCFLFSDSYFRSHLFLTTYIPCFLGNDIFLVYVLLRGKGLICLKFILCRLDSMERNKTFKKQGIYTWMLIPALYILSLILPGDKQMWQVLPLPSQNICGAPTPEYNIGLSRPNTE